jgi:hypothetical protein
MVGHADNQIVGTAYVEDTGITRHDVGVETAIHRHAVIVTHIIPSEARKPSSSAR